MELTSGDHAMIACRANVSKGETDTATRLRTLSNALDASIATKFQINATLVRPKARSDDPQPNL